MRQKRKKRLKIIISLVFIGGVSLCVAYKVNKVHAYEEMENAEISEGVEALKDLESVQVSNIEKKIDDMSRKDEVKEEENTKSVKEVFENTVFMGDSLTEPLSFYNILNDGSVVGIKGRDVIKARKKDIETVVSLNPEKIVMMYGMNDLLLFNNSKDFISNYEKLINDIKKRLPNTVLYVNSVFPVQEKAIQRDKAFNKEEGFNEALQEMCKRLEIKYIDTRDMITESKYEPDGIHLKASFYNPWLRRIQGEINLD